jgi:hypothetical protein
LANRANAPISAHSPAAESVSTPRKQRNRAITSAWPPCGSAARVPPTESRAVP